MRLALVVIAIACAAPAPATWETGRAVHAGAKREWRLYAPRQARLQAPLPLVIVLHGGGGRARGMPRLLKGGFERLADRDGFLVAYPDALHRTWNDGREPEVSKSHAEQVDDVGFIADLIAAIGERHPLDPARVYACGISNGALMSCRLACELADRITAVALVAGSFPTRLAPSCVPARPISVLMIGGTDDPLVPFNGGTIQIKKGWKERGEVLGYRDAAARWAALDGCPAASSTPLVLPDRDPRDKTRIVRERWGPGKEGAEVILLTVRGGGHTWPGGRQYLPAMLVGHASNDLDACAAIWSFFKSHARVRSHPI